MPFTPFRLERYFAQHEFSARYSLSSSDCEALAVRDLLALADEESRALWGDLTLGYTESQGLPLLRRQIASLYGDIDAQQVMVLVPEEGILVTMIALLRAGDHVICTFPGYQSLYQVAKWLGCEVSLWEPHEEDGWRYDPAVLATQLRPKTRLVVCNYPHNPTGYLPTREEFGRILGMVQDHGAYLFSDEMYRCLELEPSQRLPSAVEGGSSERTVVLSGLSKAYGLAGLRLGWLVSRDAQLLQQIAILKDYTTICNSAPSEILALIALRASDTIIGRNVGRLRRNLGVLDRFLAEHGERFSWTRPRAGTVTLLRLAGGMSAARWCEDVLRDTGIMMLPSTVFDYGDQHVRLGFGREDLPRALFLLRDYLQG